MESSSHHSIFFSVPPFDQYRLLMAKYRNGVMIRRVPFPIWANCPPSKKACSTGSFVCVRNAMARSAPMEEATTIASRSTPCRCRKSSTCRISSSLRHVSAPRSKRWRWARCRNIDPANTSQSVRCSLLSHPLHERTARQDSSCRRMFETAFLSPQLSIKSIMIAASAAEMTAIPTVPNSHFLPLSLAVM